MNNETERIKDPMPDEFASRAEVAEFWDTHDITDYLDELQPITVRFSDTVTHGVIITFEPGTFDEICELARERNTSPEKLVHQWIVERLESQRASLQFNESR